LQQLQQLQQMQQLQQLQQMMMDSDLELEGGNIEMM